MTINYDELLADCVDFAQRLIQTPSMPKQEGEISKLVIAELKKLDFDEVWIDEIGNANGRVYGRDRSLPAILMNSHLDHVDPGDRSLWEVDPFSAEIIDNHIIGRGASDIKGPLATQVYSLAGLRRNGERPLRDVVFSAVVEEEVGGAGAQFFAEQVDYPIGLVIISEPSSNKIALGHRGIRQIWVTFIGRSAHASAPDRAINPNYALGVFLQRVEAAQHSLPEHARLGPTTVSPTVIEVDTKSRNVTPAWTRVCLDFRTAAASVQQMIDFIAEQAAGFEFTTSNAFFGAIEELDVSDTIVTGYDTEPTDPAVERAQAIIAEGMGSKPPLTRYEFATDGRFFRDFGPIIGYAPGDETQAHIAGERISIDRMADSLRGHIQLLREF